MFGVVESLQGPSAAAVDSDDEGSAQASSSSTSRQQVPADVGAERFSLWGMATALAENVKKSTAEIAARCVVGLHHQAQATTVALLYRLPAFLAPLDVTAKLCCGAVI